MNHGRGRVTRGHSAVAVRQGTRHTDGRRGPVRPTGASSPTTCSGRQRHEVTKPHRTYSAPAGRLTTQLGALKSYGGLNAPRVG